MVRFELIETAFILYAIRNVNSLEDHSIKILHTESSCGWGGQEIRILTEMAGMTKRGYDLYLLCPPQSKIYEAAQKQNLSVTAIPIARKNIKGLLAVRNWLKNNPVDIIITHSSTDSWLTAVVCKTLSTPPPVIRLRHVSAPVHNNLPTRWLYNRACAHIITTGECIREQLALDNGFDKERITSIPTGIDLKRYVPGDKKKVRRELGLPESDHIVGVVATLRSWKGHIHLVEAFARLQKQAGVHLVVVGGGPKRPTLEAMVEEYQLQGKVTFSGNVENTVPWFQAIDTFVLPSYANEGVPQALMQAMACGNAVIGGDVGGIPETVEEGITGLLFPPKDVSALALAIDRLIEDSNLATQMGAAARGAAQNRFGLEIMIDKMIGIINRVLDKKTEV